MANRIDWTALKTYIAANYIKNVENFISPTKHNNAIADILDTSTIRHATVANMTALNALVYGTHFGENDIRTVLSDADGVKGTYIYCYDEDTSALAWIKTSGFASNINRTEVGTTTLRDALVLGTDFEAGDTVIVTIDDDGLRSKWRYMYDEATTSNKWCEDGILSNAGIL